jgi:hypothetical protein
MRRLSLLSGSSLLTNEVSFLNDMYAHINSFAYWTQSLFSFSANFVRTLWMVRIMNLHIFYIFTERLFSSIIIHVDISRTALLLTVDIVFLLWIIFSAHQHRVGKGNGYFTNRWTFLFGGPAPLLIFGLIFMIFSYLFRLCTVDLRFTFIWFGITYLLLLSKIYGRFTSRRTLHAVYYLIFIVNRTLSIGLYQLELGLRRESRNMLGLRLIRLSDETRSIDLRLPSEINLNHLYTNFRILPTMIYLNYIIEKLRTRDNINSEICRTYVLELGAHKRKSLACCWKFIEKFLRTLVIIVALTLPTLSYSKSKSGRPSRYPEILTTTNKDLPPEVSMRSPHVDDVTMRSECSQQGFSHFYKVLEDQPCADNEPILIGHDMLEDNDEFIEESMYIGEEPDYAWHPEFEDNNFEVKHISEIEIEEGDVIYKMTYSENDDEPGMEQVSIAEAFTAYKTVDKKVVPISGIFPQETTVTRKIPEDPLLSLPDLPIHPPEFSPTAKITAERLQILRINEEGFLWPEEEKLFQQIMVLNEKALAFDESEKGILSRDYFSDYKIATIPHTPWQHRNYPVAPGIKNKVVDLLRSKIDAGLYEYCQSSYRSNWFCVVKKNGMLRMVHDLQQLNAVTIRDAGLPPILDDFVEDFAGRQCYTVLDCFRI